MWWRILKSKSWWLAWFFLIPAAAAVTAEFLLVRRGVFIEVAPWRLLLIVALAAFGLLSVKQYLPFWRDALLEERAAARRDRKEAGRIARRLGAYLDRYGKDPDEIDEGRAAKLARELDDLKDALEKKDAKRTREGMETLKEAGLPARAFPAQSSALELVKIFGTAILLAVALRSFVVEPFKIPSASMIPTLQIGDHIFVAKFSYGLTLPFVKAGKLLWKPPRRGDVIVFRPPHDPKKDFIKRVIGLPGDVLEVRDSILYVNDVPIPRCELGWSEYNDRDQETQGWRTRKGILSLERLGDDYFFVMNSPYSSSWGPRTVGEGALYVIGDNRDNSFDSRAWGGVPFDNIKGQGMLIWWSNGPGPSLRIGRMGHRIMGKPYAEPSIAPKVARCLGELAGRATVAN